MSDTIRHYIDGAWSDGTDYRSATLTNPATGAESGTVELGTEADVDRAVEAARRAFETWSRSSVPERVDLLAALAAELERRADDLARAVTLDMGMPHATSRMAVGAAVLQIQQLVDALPAFPFEQASGSFVQRLEPIGVCALIPPWNYPAVQMTEKVAPALAAGCTMVLKPAEIASHSAEVFAEILHVAGVPAGVVNVVMGKGSVVGTALTRHPDVDMVALTGSTRVGVQVQQDAAETVKRVSLELGGKSAQVVLPDADLAAAARIAVTGVMSNSGQTCAAPTRTLVPRARLDEFLDHVRRYVGELTVGDPTTDVALGPVVSEQQWNTVQSYLEIGLEEGATLVTGGPGKPEGLETGWFVQPTVFADVTNDMRIAREEIFGPVMSVIGYDTVPEAIAIANDSPYGLAAYVNGTDAAEVHEVASRLRAGQVMVNTGYPDITAPFGGYKQSGNGRIWGPAALTEYLESKAVVGAA